MLPSYHDIHEAIAEAGMLVKWYDENGCPRACDFHVNHLGVYDEIALLVEIACQDCGQRFFVGEGWSSFQLYMREGDPNRDPDADPHGPAQSYKIEDIAEKYHYGDPPIHGCIGDTMNCVEVRIVEAWSKDGKETEKKPGIGLVVTKMPVWTRRPDIEAYDIIPDWWTSSRS